MRRHRLVFLLPILLAACVSAEKRFEQGNEEEAAGRWASACESYLDALRRDAEYPGARERARVTGDRAVEEWLGVAAELEAAGRYPRALDEYRRIDRLVERAAAVGVVLDTLEDYRARRRNAFFQAAEQQLTDAAAVAGAGRWEEAVATFRSVRARGELTAEQADRARAGEYDALLVGVRAEASYGHFGRAEQLAAEAVAVFGPESPRSREAVALAGEVRRLGYEALVADARAHADEGRYQRAWTVVQEALAVYGADAPESAGANELAVRILDEGTLHLVALPVAPERALAGFVPASLIDGIDGPLEEEHWVTPPPFVAVVEPRAVRREIRRLGFGDEALAPGRAAAVGESLGAHVVAVVSVEGCRFDSVGGPEWRTARTRSGGTVRYGVYDRLELSVRLRWRLVAVADARVLAEGRLAASASRRHRHAREEGTLPDDVLLTWEEHSWFDPDRLATIERELETEVARDLVPRIAGTLYDETTRRLP